MYLGRFENRIDILRAAVDHALDSWGCMKRKPTDSLEQYIDFGKGCLMFRCFYSFIGNIVD